MNFNIQSTNNIYEHISNQFLVYLYNFVNSNYNENNISMLKGNIEVLHGYLHMINYLHEKFLDLHISISLSLYLSFEDNLAKQYCADTFGDGIGVIESDVNNISSSDIVNNSYSLPNGVVKFNELKYFENLTTINGTDFDHQTYVLFRNCKNTLQELDLRNITSIPSDYALVGLSALKIINNTSQLRNLGNCTFCKCTSLENVSITNLTNTIGYGTFIDCTALKTANIDSTVQTKIPNDIFSNCTSLTTVSGFSHCTSIGVRSFQNCSSLTTLNITNLDLITFIDQLAFENCISLTTVNFPNVTTIGISAFKGCTSLTTFTGSNLTKIKNQAFIGCTSLTSINLSNVTSIEPKAFNGCTSLTDIGTDLSNCTYLSWDDVFKNAPITNDIIIQNNNFYGNNPTTSFIGTKIRSLTVKQNINISNKAFGGRNYNNTPYLGNNNNLLFVDLSESEFTKGSNGFTFQNDINLRLVKYPETFTQWGRMEFEGCTNLEAIVLPTPSVPSKVSTSYLNEDHPLWGVQPSVNVHLYVKDELVNDFKNDSWWGEYTNIIKPISEYVEITFDE